MILAEETTRNLYDFYVQIATIGRLELGVVDAIPFVGNRASGWPAFILGGKRPGSDTIENIASGIEEGRLPAKWLREIEVKSDFDALVAKHKIRQIAQWTGMGLKRRGLYANADVGSASRITIIEDPAHLPAWKSVIEREILNSENLSLPLFQKILADDQFQFYALWIEDKIVSTCLLFIKDGVAGIYLVATDRDNRNRGYGTKIVSSALNDCISKGIHNFVLHSTKLGVSLYRNLGFSENSPYGIYWMLGKR